MRLGINCERVAAETWDMTWISSHLDLAELPTDSRLADHVAAVTAGDWAAAQAAATAFRSGSQHLAAA